MLKTPFSLPRYRLRFNCYRLTAQHLLHRDPGLGLILPVPVLPARAALGQVQPALEHTELRGGHPTQEQDSLAGRQLYQLHLPRHRVLGVSGSPFVLLPSPSMHACHSSLHCLVHWQSSDEWHICWAMFTWLFRQGSRRPAIEETLWLAPARAGTGL